MKTLPAIATTIALLSFAFVSQSRPSAKAGPEVRFDGVYQSEQVRTYFYYVRFLKDGTAITVTSEESPYVLSQWFNSDFPGAGRGRYVATGGTVKFSATSATGTLHYSGTMQGSAITFRMRSDINGVEKTHNFRFVKDGTNGG